MKKTFLAVFSLLVLYLCESIVWGFTVPDPCPCGPIGGENAYEDIRPVIQTRPAPMMTNPSPPKDSRQERKRRAFLRRLDNEILRVKITMETTLTTSYSNVIAYSGSRLFRRDSRSIPIDAFKKSGAFSQGTKISTENMRRSVAILGTLFRGDLSPSGLSGYSANPEDAKFMADQAGLAMQGAPLQVHIPETDFPSITKEQKEELVAILETIEQQVLKADEMTRTCRDLEKKLLKRKEEIEREKGKGFVDSPAFDVQKDVYWTLKEEYDKAVVKEEAARATVKETQTQFRKKVKIIMVQ